MAERTGETTDTPLLQPSVKRAGTILVSGVTSELSKNDIWIYFQKKKNSGGEVLDVLMKMDSGEALVYFDDCKVAEAVVERQGHVIKGRAVNVKLCDAEDKKRRTVLVSGFPTGTTKQSITIHFQRKKNGGGEVEDVEILETGKALVVFEDLGVAEAIINKKQTFKGEVLTLRSMATELDLIKAIKQGDVDIVGKEERTILVSELPEGIPKNTIHIHFQRKKNNGGEVEDTVLLPGGKQAWVIFEDPKVAEKVVDIEQIIQGKRVRVELLKTETKATEWSVESATILVSDLPEGVTENRITMHFQKRKNGGGEVKKVQLSSDRKEATVTFDDPKVAEKVVDTEQIIQGKQVRVELLKTETQATERIVESATILVSGLPEGVTENRITMHFQKRRNGGGEVKKVQLSSDRKEATVTFDDPKVAEKVVDTEQIIQGKRVRVELLKTETKATERSVESATILVSGLPEGVTENRITMHFQKRKDGGGDVKKVQLLSDKKEATVTFDDPKVAKTAVSMRHEIQRTPVTVILLDNDEEELVEETPPEVVANPEVTRTSEVGTPPEVTAPEGMKTPTSEVLPPGVTTATKVFETEENLSEAKTEETMPHKVSSFVLSSQEVDQVFSMVSATVNPALMNTVAPPASENFWSDVFNVIIKSCGVQCQPSTYGVMLTGRLSQVVSAGEILKLKWRSHCQDLQLRNVDYYNVFNQAGTIFSQHGMAMNQAGTTMNQAGTAMYQAGTTMNQAGTTMNQAGTAMNQAGTAMYQAGTTMNQAGTAMNQDGTAMNQAGTAMYQAGTTMNQDGTAMNQAGTAMNQAGTTFNQYGTTFKPRDTNFNHSNMYIYRGSTHINQSDMHFTERGRNMNQTGARFNQRGTTFRQDDWPVSRSDTNLNQYTPTFIPSPGITHFNQSGSNFNLHGTTNSIERQGFMSSEHAFDPRSESQFYQQNMNCSSDPRNQQTKRNDSEQWPNEDKWEDNKTRDPGNARYNQHRQSDGNARQDQPSDSKQLSITDDTANSQPFGNPPNTKYTAQSHCGDETDPTRNSQLSPPGFMDESPNSSSMEGDASGSKTDSFSTKPATSLYSTGNPRPLDNAHNRTSTKTTTGTENTTLNVDGTSPPCNTKVIAMPERSLNYTTCYQPAENHQQSTTPNFSIKPESLTTPSNQFVSLSNDKTDPRSERPPTLLHNTTNHQQPVNHQESSISNTATGAEELTTSRNLLGLVSNGQPESRSEKPPGLSETNINPSPQVDEQQGTTTDPTTGPQNSTNSSNKVGSPANDQPDGNSEKPPPDSTTNHQPPSNGQKSTAKNPTIGSPNSATSDDNQTETPSTNTSDSLGENPSNPIEKIPSNQPQNNQQQTIPNQILKQTSTHEHPNNNTLPNNSPNLKEAKRTIPVPPPRQNRPGPRQNAAKFSTPAAKPQQPRQGSPSPTTESNKNCVNDKPTTATEPNKEGDQTATTENSKASITTDEQSEKALDEQLD